jgi:hypothetical protein
MGSIARFTRDTGAIGKHLVACWELHPTRQGNGVWGHWPSAGPAAWALRSFSATYVAQGASALFGGHSLRFNPAAVPDSASNSRPYMTVADIDFST